MQRIRRSFQLIMQSYRVLMQDKELLVLPVISGICVLAVCISFALPMRLWDIEGA